MALDTIDVQLTYLQLDTYERHEDRRTFACDELAAFCADLIERYLHWALLYHQWCAERDISLEAFKFPFAEYRPGQRDLAVVTYRTIDGPRAGLLPKPRPASARPSRLCSRRPRPSAWAMRKKFST